MESKNHKVVKDFLSKDERKSIIDWVKSIDFTQTISNHHINEVRKNLNGNSYMFDISKTQETKFISNFQSSGNIICSDVPDFIHNLITRISCIVGIPKDKVFLQVIDMKSGGKVKPHYDASIEGYVNYKCNISVLSENYKFYVDKDVFSINESDLYCFEASLYKHWSDEFNFNRILLSFGFVLSYSELGRNEDDPRVRLSNRILKYFQNL